MSTSSASDDSSTRFYGGSIEGDNSLEAEIQQQHEASFIDTGRCGFALGRKQKFSPYDDDDEDDRLVLLSTQKFGNINSSALGTEFVSAEAEDEDPEKVPSSQKVIKFAAAAPVIKETKSRRSSSNNDEKRKRRFSLGCMVIALAIIAIIVLLALAILEFTSPKSANFASNNQTLNNNSSSSSSVSDNGSSDRPTAKDTSDMNAPTLSPSSTTAFVTNVPTIAQSTAPTENPAIKVQYGDIAFFELMYADDNEESIKNEFDISSLWLSGGRGKYNNLVMTRDLVHDSNEQNKTQGYYEWIVRSDVTQNGNRLQKDPKDGECMKYGDTIWLQVNRPAHRWISGGRGGQPTNHSEVTTHDVVYDTEESWISYQYRWTIRSNHVILKSGGGSQDFSANWQPSKDPKDGRCVTYTDILYLQLWWKPTHWLTGGRHNVNITHYPPIGSRPMEQVYSRNVNQMDEVDNKDLFQWMIHNCALDCEQ